MTATSPLEQLVSALLDPAGALANAPRAWNDVLLLAREHDLLARLAFALADAGVLQRVPAKAQAQLGAARIAAESTHTAVRFEINRILRALCGRDIPVVLLKGAAYVLAELPSARGRMVGDVDLMVPKEAIAEVERALVAYGWAPSDMSDYDQRYYRQWSHQIPPLQHPERETPIDIHHTITQSSGRYPVDAAALFATAVKIGDGRLRVLAPADMVLHSAVHLFNTEVGKPLRDLFDLHDLLVQFSGAPGFWTALQARAALHSLERPLYYALRYTQRLLGTPVPGEVGRAAAAAAPAAAVSALMDWLFAALLVPAPSQKTFSPTAIARGLLYLRTHWLNMPPLMLARHLSIKAASRVREKFARNPENADT